MANPDFPAIPVLLVDGDIVAYRCAAAAEKTKYLVSGRYRSDDYEAPMCDEYDTAKEAKAAAVDAEANYDDIKIWSRKELEPVEHALQITKTMMQSIADKWPESIVQVYLSGDRNFRDDVWRTRKYKGNRDQPKPAHLRAVQDYLRDRWHARTSVNQEADDDIGIDAGKEGSVVVSTDKDLDQIPGWHYNFVSGDVYYVKEEDAEQFFWEQVIAGDSTDNIPGLPDYGLKTARKYLDLRMRTVGGHGPEESYHDYVYALFQKEGFGYEYFHEMVTLIKILREPRQ